MKHLPLGSGHGIKESKDSFHLLAGTQKKMLHCLNAKISDTPFDQRSLIHLEAWFPPCFERQNQQKKNRPLPNKNVQMLDHFFPLLFPKDSESLNIFDIQLLEVGAKRPLNGTSKVNRQTDGQTNTQTDGHFNF